MIVVSFIVGDFMGMVLTVIVVSGKANKMKELLQLNETV